MRDSSASHVPDTEENGDEAGAEVVKREDELEEEGENGRRHWAVG